MAKRSVCATAIANHHISTASRSPTFCRFGRSRVFAQTAHPHDNTAHSFSVSTLAPFRHILFWKWRLYGSGSGEDAQPVRCRRVRPITLDEINSRETWAPGWTSCALDANQLLWNGSWKARSCPGDGRMKLTHERSGCSLSRLLKQRKCTNSGTPSCSYLRMVAEMDHRCSMQPSFKLCRRFIAVSLRA